MTLDIAEASQRTDPRLGRNKVHDPRSLGFAVTTPIDKSAWRTKSIRIYDPLPNPNQVIGNCTGVSKCVQLNAAGNRKVGRVLKMADANAIYSTATQLDPFAGSWPPADTGSDGLSACKAAVELGIGGQYRWILTGADGVVEEIMAGRAISVGTWWYQGMFDQDAHGFIRPTGEIAGGHQYTIHGYDKVKDAVKGRCWWGPTFRDFWMARTDLDALLHDGGDAHFQASV